MNKDEKHLEEPSLLDYLKSRFKFWERGPKLEFSDMEHAKIPLVEGIPTEEQLEISYPPDTTSETILQTNQFPWRSLLALGSALLGQMTFEPSPARTAIPGLLLYGFSLILLILAYRRNEWKVVALPETSNSSETERVRRIPLILGVLLASAATLSLGNNLFTKLNVALWVLAIILFVWAFWLSGDTRSSYRSQLIDFFARDAWKLRITRWILLSLVIIAIVLFYRIYNLNGVPSEPFSDHAEKILDVYDISQGQTHIFFPRNTGRESIQIYLTLIVSWIFGTGLSFLSLKIGTVICGLVTLPYMYQLGKEFGGKRVGLLAVFFAGIAYWPNVISRAGLRFPLYPLFVAPTLFHLLRGLRTKNRNDFIISGLFLGLGLHGYSPFRIMPILVLIAIVLFMLHAQSKNSRRHALLWVAILAIISLIVFLPLARYWIDNPGSFSYRAFSRLGTVETPLPAPIWQVFVSNTWNALRMFNWDDGEIWVHSVTHRPALDVVSGALFVIGVMITMIRYIRRRHWQDIFLLVSIPVLLLPSILSLAYPGENPALNRASGAIIPVFLLAAMSMDGLVTAMLNMGWKDTHHRPSLAIATQVEGVQGKSHWSGIILTWMVVIFLSGWSAYQNYDLVFNQYDHQYKSGAWNSSEIGAVIKQFGLTYGTTDTVWIVPYPHWVDTRLPGIWAGIPNRDFALWPDDFNSTRNAQGTKLFIVNSEDVESMIQLKAIYPQGVWSRFVSKTKLEGKDFMIFFAPAEQGSSDPINGSFEVQ